MNDCIFCKIAHGELPTKKIYEDNRVVGFLDINPASLGHVLVITKNHYQGLISVPHDELTYIIGIVKIIAVAIREATNADGLNILQSNGTAAGQIIPHIHFHIIPRFKDDGVMFRWQKKELTEDEMERIKNNIISKLQR